MQASDAKIFEGLAAAVSPHVPEGTTPAKPKRKLDLHLYVEFQGNSRHFRMPTRTALEEAYKTLTDAWRIGHTLVEITTAHGAATIDLGQAMTIQKHAEFVPDYGF